jgi:hypothetical protein
MFTYEIIQRYDIYHSKVGIFVLFLANFHRNFLSYAHISVKEES